VSDDVTIAVIAMDGAFPGAPDVESYWRIQRWDHGDCKLDAPSLQALGVPETLRADPAYIPSRPT
jgi:acyl transferase domain-containing protein